MPEPIFQNEPAPAQPPRRRMGNGAKIAIGCGVLVLLASGACGGVLLWCGKSVGGLGDAEWRDLQQVAAQLDNDAGAQAVYASHPGLAAAYPTSEDFVGQARLWRRDLEPLPVARPSLMSGKLGLTASNTNGRQRTVLRYPLASGKTLEGTWEAHQLTDLRLE